ncbi:leucine-rich repeat-containing protein 49 [Varanus komodoensis]|uniref:leucine-rich repeat-containing protein 49 n=1 Tax=Varanus komodoensis TaxID=61221 RepID=UPI001CF7E51C|nr:leucine-rich repeat-containing protein 49 [Varanus komodoensis]
MVPSKCRPAAGARPGHAVSANNYGLQLVLQSTSAAERTKPLELRLHKDQPYLHNKFLQHELEKNYSGKLDGRLSPLSRNKKLYVPVSTNFADIPGLEMKYSAGSLAAFGDCSFPTPSKYRLQQGCHNASGNVPENITYGNTAFPLVHRTAEEKTQHSDRLTLERQKLTVCPIIDGEEHLRLLNFQHNCITRIQNISNLQHLIFLDLYDNQIEEISGLSTLRSLRVLLLGNNRIKRISDLDNLVSLDVLDLHGNQIAVLENLNHLSDLRVLNLARNCLTYIENLNGLDSLTELNLRYNQIRFVKDVDTLPCLQRLFLSFNNIYRFDDIVCLADSASISEITLDGNPIAQETWYKPTVLHHMMQLRQLDMKKITEEERRIASVALRKEEERRRESHKQTLLKEKKRLTISNIARQWENQQNRFGLLPSSQENNKENESCQNNRSAAYLFPEETRSLDSLLSKATQGLSVLDSHLVEIDGDTLYLYGAGALESLDRNWSIHTAGSVATIAFIFIDFDEIVPVLPKLKIKFPNSLHLKFKETSLVTLQQFNALAHLRRLEQLTVEAQGNPVVTFTLWKYYVLFRLSHFSLQKINGIEVTQNDMVMAERLFGVLACVASSDMPYCRLLALLGDCRKKQLCYLLEAKGKKFGSTSEDDNDRRKLGGENASRSTLNYTTRDSQTEKLEEMKDRKNFCQSYIQGLVKEATDINLKNESLQKLWPQMFIELVKDAVIEIRNKDSYMKLCLQRIADQKS